MCNAIRPAPRASSLSGDALRGRLRALAGEEREAQVEFLLHLSEFDHREGYLDAGYGSLWTYCLRELRLREGPAARRIGAMRILRQYPALESPLRDGRLCLTTVTLIAPLLAQFGVEELVARAAYLTKAEVEHLVATLRPGSAPRDGIRQLASRYGSALSIHAARVTLHPDVDGALSRGSPGECSKAAGSPFADPGTVSRILGASTTGATPVGATSPPTSQDEAAGVWRAEFGERLTDSRELDPGSAPVFLGMRAPEEVERRTAELRPVTADQWSLRVTMDAGMKEDLELLRSLLSHTAGNDLTAIVREALRCGVEKHGKRRGAIAPDRPRSGARPASGRSASGHLGDSGASGGQRGSDHGIGAARLDTTPLRVRGASDHGVGAAGLDTTPVRVRGSSEPRASGSSEIRSSGPTGAQSGVSANSADTSRERFAARGALDPAVTDRDGGRSSVGDPSVTNAVEKGSSPRAASVRAIPAAVRREVWARDQGCCSWKSKDGRRCGSRWKLELDHIQPVALGGASTADNLRLTCRSHNVRHAERIFGREHMAKWRRGKPTPFSRPGSPACTDSSASASPAASTSG